MKKTVISLVALLSLFAGFGFATNSKVDADTTSTTIGITQEQIIGSSVITNIQQGNVNDEDGSIQPRIGYRWHCNTCGYTSEWHAFASTAITNANNHRLKNPGHDAYVYGV